MLVRASLGAVVALATLCAAAVSAEALEAGVSPAGAATLSSIPPSAVLASLPKLKLGAHALAQQPGDFPSAVRAFYEALQAHDLDQAHALCAGSFLWQAPGGPPAPPELTTLHRRRGKHHPKNKPMAIDLLEGAVSWDINALDIVQCVLESGQAPLRAPDGRGDWFGLTEAGRPELTLHKALANRHPGLAAALLERGADGKRSGPGASGNWDESFMFHRILNNGAAHRFVRSGLNPQQSISVAIPWVRYDELTNLLLPFGVDVALEYQQAIERLGVASTRNVARLSVEASAHIPSQDVLWEDARTMFACRQALTIKVMRDHGLT